MINILKSGRLGNNLFQFAFGLAFAKDKKSNFIFNTSDIESFFELNNYNHPVLKKLRKIKYLFSLKFNSWKRIDLNLDIEPCEMRKKIENNAILYGYFQSQDYFIHHEELIKKNFKLRKNIKNCFLKLILSF
jgi:hypothetical protein